MAETPNYQKVAPAKPGINWTNVAKDAITVGGVILIADGAMGLAAKSAHLPALVLTITTAISVGVGAFISGLANFIGSKKS